jgi:hypothetical protein
MSMLPARLVIIQNFEIKMSRHEFALTVTVP